ncbi:MAG TPA: hypothetical protein DD401_00810 [Prevotella sp.]|nr:hypothetical protein [Prevotella sp.]
MFLRHEGRWRFPTVKLAKLETTINPEQMKKILTLAAGCLMTLAAHADGAYAYLTFTNHNQVEQSFQAEGLTITFADGKALVSQNGQQVSLPLAELEKMYFSAEPAGVSEVKADGDEPLTVVNLAGQRVGTFRNRQAMRSSLKKGLYIVKSASKTYKMEVK